MRDLKKAFGRPDPEFTLRVAQTLNEIEERDHKKSTDRHTLWPVAATAACLVLLLAMAGIVTARKGGLTPDSAYTPAASGDHGTTSYWLDDDGTYYHRNVACDLEGMSFERPRAVTAFEIADKGYEACPLCVTGEAATPSGATQIPWATSSPSPLPLLTPMVSPTPMPLADALDAPEQTPITDAAYGHIMVWTSPLTDPAGADAAYYHRDASCTSIQEKDITMPLYMAALAGRTPCPACAGRAEDGEVIIVRSFEIYHRDEACKLLEDGDRLYMPPEEALRLGCEPCPKCGGESVIVMIEASDPFYHNANVSCPMALNEDIARAATLGEALKYGFMPCPACMAGGVTPLPMRLMIEGERLKALFPSPTEDPVFWATPQGHYYHAVSDCSGMANAQRVTYAEAVAAGQAPCPLCLATNIQVLE